MRHKTIKTSLLSISMSVLATVAVTHLNSVPSVYAQESNYSIGTYTVKAGDGVYRIAMNHGMTMEDLKQLNGLTSNLIHPGDILKVYLKENTATENQPVKEESESQASNNASTPVDDQTEVPSQPTTPSKPTTNKTYTVRPGDWLGKIAGQYGITVNQLKAWNNLSSDLIHPGNVLIVAKGEAPSPAPTPDKPSDSQPTTPSKPTTSKTYTVRPGDWLGKIAGQYGITVNQLKAWNNLSSDLIHPGNVLIVAKGEAPSPAPTPDKPSDSQPTTPSKPTTSKTYTVRPGDWLGKIAGQYGITVNQLKAWNNLSSDLIHPGNVLIVAKGEAPSPAPTPDKPSDSQPTTPSKPTTSKTYTVRPGDWLGKIAGQYGITVNQLKAWNNLSSDLIHPGNVLIVAKGEAPSPAPTPDKPSDSQPTTPSKPTTSKTYTVRPGDWLGKIAGQYGITVNQLKAWNNLSSDLIHPGNVLIVAKGEAPSPAPTPDKPSDSQPTTPSKPTTSKTYTVRPGDWLAKIADQFGITVNQLKTWNNLRSNYIYAGDILLVSQPNDISDPKPNTPDKTGQDKVKTYVVQSGDSLYSVAKNFGVSVSNLKKWNEMTSNTLYEGYALIVNDAQPSSPVIRVEDQGDQYKDNQSLKHTPYEYSYHIVQAGDSLETISWQHEIKVSELKKLNNLTTTHLTVGQKILISKVPTQEKVNIEPTEVTNANVERLLDIARSYLGVTKYSPEHRALVDAYNRIYPKPVGYSLTYDDDWCDAFVTHIADEAGLSRLTGREVGVERHKNIVKNKGIWMGLTKPKAGDIIFFNWDGYRNGWGHHIGIVESYNNGLITTFEGNTTINDSKRMVARKEFAWDSIYIQGYGRPRY